MTVSFVVVVLLKEVGVRPTFQEAYTDFYHTIRAELKRSGFIANTALKYACWIERRMAGAHVHDWPFLAANREASRRGILDESGKLIESR